MRKLTVVVLFNDSLDETEEVNIGEACIRGIDKEGYCVDSYNWETVEEAK